MTVAYKIILYEEALNRKIVELLGSKKKSAELFDIVYSVFRLPSQNYFSVLDTLVDKKSFFLERNMDLWF